MEGVRERGITAQRELPQLFQTTLKAGYSDF